jgi:hypothetical protein
LTEPALFRFRFDSGLSHERVIFDPASKEPPFAWSKMTHASMAKPIQAVNNVDGTHPVATLLPGSSRV